MVDFQSRDTRRGPTTDDESESESDSSADAASSEADATGAAEATGGTTGESETETDSDSTATEAREAAESTPADSETADGDPLAEDYSSTAAETADERGDTGQSATTADTEAAAAAADTEASTTAVDTEQSGAEGSPQASDTATPTRAIDVAVVTVAGDRAALEDTVTTAFESAGHAVVRRERLRGGYDGIQQMVDALVGRAEVDVVVTVGGVGLAADEMAIEAVHPLLEKALPGFGEAFRARLADHVGTGIVGVRSTAGVSDGTLVFCLPGDVAAAELAVSEILATEAPDLVSQLEG